MRSAPCALAPSHPLHVMPSRITRNSHRPRASDRTMVASEATSSLAALSNSMASSPSAEKLTRMDNKPNFSREVKLQWAGCRETISLSGQGGAFFLTSLFIELIGTQKGEGKAHACEMAWFRQLISQLKVVRRWLGRHRVFVEGPRTSTLLVRALKGSVGRAVPAFEEVSRVGRVQVDDFVPHCIQH